MRLTSLLRRLLGFPRLSVRSARFEGTSLVVEVAPRGRARCSRCGRKSPGYDTLAKRRWRHLDFGDTCVFLESALRRVECRRCGIVVEQVSFAGARSGFTQPFEDMVGWLAQRCDKTTIATQMRIAWRTVGAILERVIERRRGKIDLDALTAISVDELSYRKGHRYITIVTDLSRGRVIWTKEGKSADTLGALFEEIGPENCAMIRHAAIDMSAAYTKAIKEYLPNAKIVYDRFHVMQLLSEAVDEVRRSEWRRLEKGTERDSIKHSRYALLRRPWNVTPDNRETLATLQKRNGRIYRSYLLKESFASIYDRLLLPGWARRRIKAWLSWASRSRLESFTKVARTVRRHHDGILAFFETGFTTSYSEGLNNKARTAMRQAYGFHSPDAVRAMIELRCSGIVMPIPRRT